MNYLDCISLDKEVELFTRFFHTVKTREDILAFEKEITQMDIVFMGNPFPTFHSFANGMYTREVHVPAGHLIVGAIHKNDYFVNVPKGRLWVVSEFGAKEVIGPTSFVCKAGIKNIGFIIEDLVWIDTHKTNETEVDKAEKDIFVDSYQELDDINHIIDDVHQKLI